HNGEWEHLGDVEWARIWFTTEFGPATSNPFPEAAKYVTTVQWEQWNQVEHHKGNVQPCNQSQQHCAAISKRDVLLCSRFPCDSPNADDRDRSGGITFAVC